MIKPLAFWGVHILCWIPSSDCSRRFWVQDRLVGARWSRLIARLYCARVFVIHSAGLERSRTERTYILRRRREKRALIKARVYTVARCIFNDTRLVLPANIQPVCLDFRYPNHNKFISTLEGGLVLTWQDTKLLRFFPAAVHVTILITVVLKRKRKKKIKLGHLHNVV